MEESVLTPPKIHLDTNHLINIRELRKGQLPPTVEKYRMGYEFIDDRVRNRSFGLIFNPAAALEWVEGQATLEQAKQTASVIDSSPLQYEVETDKFVWLAEVLDECVRVKPDLRIPKWDKISHRKVGRPKRAALAELTKHCADYFEEGELDTGLTQKLPCTDALQAGYITVSEHVELAFKLREEQPQVFRERVDGYKSAYIDDATSLATHSIQEITAADKRRWLLDFLRVDRILRASDSTIKVEEVLDAIDLCRCPAVSLFCNARLCTLKAKPKPNENDGDDWSLLPVIPYADLVAVDHGFRHFLHQADPTLKSKVTSNPNDFPKMLQQWA